VPDVPVDVLVVADHVAQEDAIVVKRFCILRGAPCDVEYLLVGFPDSSLVLPEHRQVDRTDVPVSTYEVEESILGATPTRTVAVAVDGPNVRARVPVLPAVAVLDTRALARDFVGVFTEQGTAYRTGSHVGRKSARPFPLSPQEGHQVFRRDRSRQTLDERGPVESYATPLNHTKSSRVLDQQGNDRQDRATRRVEHGVDVAFPVFL